MLSQWMLGKRAIWLKPSGIFSLTKIKVAGGISGSAKWSGFQDSF